MTSDAAPAAFPEARLTVYNDNNRAVTYAAMQEVDVDRDRMAAEVLRHLVPLVNALHATMNLVRSQRCVEIVFSPPPRERDALMMRPVEERCRQAGVQRRRRRCPCPCEGWLSSFFFSSRTSFWFCLCRGVFDSGFFPLLFRALHSLFGPILSITAESAQPCRSALLVVVARGAWHPFIFAFVVQAWKSVQPSFLLDVLFVPRHEIQYDRAFVVSTSSLLCSWECRRGFLLSHEGRCMQQVVSSCSSHVLSSTLY